MQIPITLILSLQSSLVAKPSKKMKLHLIISSDIKSHSSSKSILVKLYIEV